MASKLIERASLGLFRRSLQQISPSSSSSLSRSSCEGLSLFRRKFSTQQNPTDSPSSSPSFEVIPTSQKERIYNRVLWVGEASNFALADLKHVVQAVRRLSRSALSCSKTTFASSASLRFSNKGYCSPGRSSAASDSSSSTPQRVPKRVSKDERRAILKAYVDKYRASNSGKYPAPSVVQKQVGGSYYVVKKILQEIEYNSQRSSVIISTTNEAPIEKVVPQEECPPSPEATEISSSAAGADLTSAAQSLRLKDDSQTVVTTNLDMDEAPFEKVPQEEFPLSLEASEISSSAAGADLNSSAQSLELKDDSQAVVTTNLDMDEATSSITQGKEETLGTIEMPFSKDALNSKTPVNASNTDENHSLQKRATVWGNLKSIADGIINMWRKM